MYKSIKAYQIIFASLALSIAGLYLALVAMGLRTDVTGFNLTLIAIIGVALMCVLSFQFRQLVKMNRDSNLSDTIGAELATINNAMNKHSIVSVTDPNANILQVNDKFVEVFGFSKEELVGKNSAFFHAKSMGNTMYDEIMDCTKRGVSWEGEHAATTKNGETRLFHATIVPYFNNKGVHVRNVSVRTDVTDTHKAEDLRKNRTILDKLQDEIYIYRVDDLKIVYLNERAQTRCEWTCEEALTKHISDTDPNFNEFAFQQYVKPLADGSKESVVTSEKQAKGHVEINTSRSVQPDGTEVYISVLRDIENRSRLDQAKMASVSVVSHELRTPLTSIKGSIQLLQAQMKDANDGAKSLLDIALRNCDRLMFIVNDILDLEKIESGKMEFNFNNLNVQSLLKDAVEINQGYADKFGVKFAFNSAVSDAYTEGDKDRLGQVMSNLMSNAVKFSNKGDTVKIGLTDNGDSWKITVSDNGPGISEEDQSKLFDSFVQVAPSDGKKREGTGLGLAITKKIVQRHGGRIGLQSALGKGSTFSVTLKKLSEQDTGSNDPISIAA